MTPLKSEFYGTECLPDNKFSRQYLDIMRTALARGVTDVYFEWHMVVPLEFFQYIPWAVKGALRDAMPEEKRVWCPLLPEEHFKSHELIREAVKLAQDEWDGVKGGIARYGVGRLTGAHGVEKPRTAEHYGGLQRERHATTDWQNYTNEVFKYHPEREK